MTTSKARVIEISPITRVEGHGKVTVHLDENNQVSEARLHIVEFRGFERFIQGRLLWEVPVIVQRLCGICPVSHHLAAAKAMDMILTGRMVEADEAEQCGMASRVVPHDDLMSVATEVASTIASYSIPSLMAAKEMVAASLELSTAEGIRFERRLFHALFSTEDQKEGMQAFIDKRDPDFKDK